MNNLKIENARIIFRNFSGKETQFNRKGVRNFSVVIEDPMWAQQLMDDGWNLKRLRQRDPDEPQHYHLPVGVRFDNVPPRIYMVTKRNKTKLNEETVDTLDYAEYKNVDVVIRPYHWEANGKSGVKAYVKEMWVTIEEDEFADKYAEEEFPEDDIPNL